MRIIKPFYKYCEKVRTWIHLKLDQSIKNTLKETLFDIRANENLL